MWVLPAAAARFPLDAWTELPLVRPEGLDLEDHPCGSPHVRPGREGGGRGFYGGFL